MTMDERTVGVSRKALRVRRASVALAAVMVAAGCGGRQVADEAAPKPSATDSTECVVDTDCPGDLACLASGACVDTDSMNDPVASYGGTNGGPQPGKGGAVGIASGGRSAGSAGSPGSIIKPYSPRSGSFKMLVYSQTKGYRHDGSIVAGKAMLKRIAAAQGFEVVVTETNDLITAAGLADFEIVFFMNTSGDIFNQVEEQAFEDWMTRPQGSAFGGVHSATDTEQGWSFYSEVTGQYYNGHGPQNAPGGIQFEANMVNHPALLGLPNPWERNEEWARFDQHQQWSAKPGFQILGRKSADGQPIKWIREWGDFRSFYSGLGHDAEVFNDPQVEQHLTGGIMWAVRRQHLIK